MKARLFKALALLGLLTLLPTAGSAAAPPQAAGDSYTFPKPGSQSADGSGRCGRAGGPSPAASTSTACRSPTSTTRSRPPTARSKKTQWFERARFEEHPENQPPDDVLLGLLGVQAARGRQEAVFAPVANPGGGAQWFSLTGHTLGDGSAGGRVIAASWTRLAG